VTFINEKGGLDRLAESQRYAEIYHKDTGKNESFINEDWTIDRERGMLLVCVHNERQDMYEGNFGLSSWLFYWHGEWIHFAQKDSLGGKISDIHWRKTRTITNIKLSNSIKISYLEMFKDLKEAFQMYRFVGAFDKTEYLFDLTLDYSKVIEHYLPEK